MRLTIAFGLGLLVGMGLTFGLAILAGWDAERQRAARES